LLFPSVPLCLIFTNGFPWLRKDGATIRMENDGREASNISKEFRQYCRRSDSNFWQQEAKGVRRKQFCTDP
jgi:hypothetical protein